jgi:hypothetical protein
MDASLRHRCELLIENYRIMSERKTFGSSYALLSAAGLYMAEDRVADPDRLEDARNIIKSSVGIFSDFRGVMEYVLRAKMAMTDDPRGYFDALREVYDQVKNGVFATSFDVIAAMILTDSRSADQTVLAENMKTIYRMMQKQHMFLTSEADRPFAALMAASGKDPEAVAARAEAIFLSLKGRLRVAMNTRQTIASILALYDRPDEEMCERICALNTLLRNARRSFGSDSYASILGILADTDLPAEELASRLFEAEDFLRGSKPFKGLFGASAGSRRMMAALCVMSDCNTKENARSAMIGTSVQITISIMVLMFIMISTVSSMN